MDALLTSIEQHITWLVNYVGARHCLAVLLGVGGALMTTQFFKMVPGIVYMRPEYKRRLVIRSYAVCFATVAVFLVWGPPLVNRALAAVTFGFSPPILYRIGLLYLRVKAPWILPKMSGDPATVAAPRKEPKP